MFEQSSLGMVTTTTTKTFCHPRKTWRSALRQDDDNASDPITTCSAKIVMIS
jgi:hypothetical protein